MNMDNDQPQRVRIAPEATTTTSPTSQENITMVPRSHQKTTRANTSMATLPIQNDEQPKRRLSRLKPDIV